MHGIDGLFPRKGRPVASGSLVETAIRKNRAVLAPHIGILDGVEEGLVAIAQPSVAAGAAGKVALVVLLERDTRLLSPQIQRTHPIVVEGFWRHL